ncbi:uncharacterized protein LOC119293818 [Triticum dicoccoides]|uniref:uncharacterized protein LOC119293818 n=1 Tax=Triticum dicoccoides TaxID=85692 RepID=UPI00188F9750|nr:uncharacterized protein LOC119293818 [Triticum dicoccoides]XP_044372829.1 uncharacterized protein LOC123095066 [Triticum aestivum]
MLLKPTNHTPGYAGNHHRSGSIEHEDAFFYAHMPHSNSPNPDLGFSSVHDGVCLWMHYTADADPGHAWWSFMHARRVIQFARSHLQLQCRSPPWGLLSRSLAHAAEI